MVDTGLCHGSAGLAHIFNRLGQATGDVELVRAARRWYDATLDMHQPGKAVAGFPSRDVDPHGAYRWLASPGFLEGAAGVGLALSAAVGGEPHWDTVPPTAIPPGHGDNPAG